MTSALLLSLALVSGAGVTDTIPARDTIASADAAARDTIVSAAAQQFADSVTLPPDARAVPVPFGPGERLEYKVKLGVFSVGEAFMSVNGVDTVRGRPSYAATLSIRGGALFAKVNDEFQSWFDISTLQSWRFIQKIHEVNYKSFRHYEMYPERRVWVREDNDDSGPLGSLLPLDDVGFLYFLRTLPLEVGKTYTYNRYFKSTGNPVVVKVVRKDRREVPAGTFETIVVQPLIRTKGLFSEGGNAELHFTDDERRLLVYLRSEIPVVGSITLHLRDIREGLPLHPDARAATLARVGAEAKVGTDDPER
ncbi:MAG: DUF3108 domain-containing protein [Gemmatimonadota bacterium]